MILLVGEHVETITVAGILTALSTALDMVEGQPEGHAARTCLLALKIADTLDLSPAEKDDLYFAALIKDSGCSSNSARVHKMFGGDEIMAKFEVKLVDWTNTVESLKYAYRATERGGSVGQKLRRMVNNIGPPKKLMDEVTAARCNRGAQIALNLGFTLQTAAAVQSLDEHWDGLGSPKGLAGDASPLLARILSIAQTMDVFAMAMDVPSAYRMVEERKGRWFDPALCDAARAFEQDEAFWKTYYESAQDAARILPLPAAAKKATDVHIDQICQAFAQVVDAKSNFTGEHSTRVMKYSCEIAESLGLDADRIKVIRRASLLHDIGKLGIPNSILEKPSGLTDDEFETVKLHPQFTHVILSKIKGFERVTEVAANHHEKLNGRGYWRGLGADQLDLDMRMIAVADIFDALSAARPYREAMPLQKVFAILDKEAEDAIDPDCVAVLKDRYRDQEYVAA